MTFSLKLLYFYYISVISGDHNPKQNCTDIFRKIPVRTLGAQSRNAYLLKTRRTDLIVVRYSAIKDGLLRNNRFVSKAV
jgi:cytolysin (calcineurin-like family phosphatase)